MTIIRKVALGLSGGVDSAVSAFLLKQKGLRSFIIQLYIFVFLSNYFFPGFDVSAVFMKNWDERDEKGFCSSDSDYEDALYISDKLEIPLTQVNYVKEYWNEVFW